MECPKCGKKKIFDFSICPSCGYEVFTQSETTLEPAFRPIENVVNYPKMTLAEMLFSFKGHIPRSTFWEIAVSYALLLFGITFISFRYIAYGESPYLNEQSVMMLSLPVFFFMGWGLFAAQVKRYHDIDTSGWMVLINLIPIIGVLIALVLLGFKKGTVGPNRFGLGPLASQRKL